MCWKTKLNELCGIDIRSLALYRIGLALILVWDLFDRLRDLQAHYADDGLMPRDMLIGAVTDPWYLSLHFINGTWQFQFLLFTLAFVFAICLMIGYKTRLMTVLSWIFLISLHTRNPLVLQGGDFVLKLLLFWAMFLPLGAYWSLDERLTPKKYDYQIVSISTFGLLLQICFIYWFSALIKSDGVWRSEGTAIWYSLSIEQYATSLGNYLLNFPTLLKYLTFATFYLEGFGPFFAFSPIWTGPLRFATAIVFILFHFLGLNLTMALGHFPYVCAVAWLVFIPNWFWDRVLVKELRDQTWKASVLSNILAAFFIGYIFFINVKSLDETEDFSHSNWDIIASVLRLDQVWNMFAPMPLNVDGWYVIPGKLRDGSEVDLYKKGAAVTWEKPPLLSDTYSNDRWRSYMMNLVTEEDTEIFLFHYADYLCHQWNMHHSYEKQLLSFDIVYMLKIIDVKQPDAAYEKTILWSHECFPTEDPT